MITLTLYIGSARHNEVARNILAAWCAEQAEIAIEISSIHDDPAVAVRLGIHHLPALVLADQVIAQGSSASWLTTTFLEELVTRLKVEL